MKQYVGVLGVLLLVACGEPEAQVEGCPAGTVARDGTCVEEDASGADADVSTGDVGGGEPDVADAGPDVADAEPDVADVADVEPDVADAEPDVADADSDVAVPDPCEPDPCENGGTCTADGTDWTCSCPAGYDGDTCETNIDDCVSEPCQNGGTCVDGVDAWSCVCPEGFTGDACETDIDECEGDPCQNGGVCSDGIGSFTCGCAAGWEGDTCEESVPDCPEENPCENGGTCADEHLGWSCECAPGFTGDSCDVFDCSLGGGCLNGGFCVEGEHWLCWCPTGLTGTRCEIDTTTCVAEPCQNGGTCSYDGEGFAVCDCPSWTTGPWCQTVLTGCALSPCANGGTCVPEDEGDGFTCECQTGFTGETCTEMGQWCEEDATCDDGDSCTADTCFSGTVCTEGTAVGDRCIEAVASTGTWEQAASGCEALGGTLVTIHDEDDNVGIKAVRDATCNSTGAWIGLNDLDTEGTFTWVSGAEAGYLNWANGEPNDSGDEDVVLLRADGLWNDQRVTNSQPCYLCELPPVTVDGACVNTPLICEDGDACTSEACDAPEGGCDYEAIECDDGDACTTDSCDTDLGCVHEAPPDCDDGDACTSDGCDPATGECTNEAWEVAVDDATYTVCPNAVVRSDAAAACAARGMTLSVPATAEEAAWIAGTAASHGLGSWWVGVADDDDNATFLGPAGEPLHYETWCDGEPEPPCTGMFCDIFGGDELCVYGGGCDGGGWSSTVCTQKRSFVCELSCDDGTACTTDSWDPETGCVYADVVCDDDDVCTVAACDPDAGCVFTPACDDGDPCTADECNETTGACSSEPLDCDDGVSCTEDQCAAPDTCPSGTMVAGRCVEAVPEPGTWESARVACLQRGGVLVTVGDGEADAVRAVTGAACGEVDSWIGLSDRLTAGTFAWESGSDAAPPWGDGEAPLGTVEGTGVIALAADGGWEALAWSDTRTCFVCESAPVPAGACANAPTEACGDGDDCAGDPCANGGTCTDGYESFTCACAPGFEGPTCEIGSDECASSPCLNGGECADGDYGFTCECADGYTGPVCQEIIDPCLDDPCNGHGDCESEGVEHTCDCWIGYSGPSCEVGPCDGEPCQNGGTCEVLNDEDIFVCECPEGYEGALCQVVDEPCSPDPCQNGGVCTADWPAYSCECPAGFEGDDCETNIDDCEGVECPNGDCVDGIESYACECDDGWEGDDCQTNPDDCVGVDCGNGTCIDQTPGYTCECDEGWGGDGCSANIDDCESVDCGNGTCLDEVAGFTCGCDEGWAGDDCQTNIDDCEGVGCGDGVCVDGVNGYTCDCNDGAEGAACEYACIPSTLTVVGCASKIDGGIACGSLTDGDDSSFNHYCGDFAVPADGSCVPHGEDGCDDSAGCVRDMWYRFDLPVSSGLTRLRFLSDWWSKRPNDYEIWVSDSVDAVPDGGATLVFAGTGAEAPWQCVAGEPCVEDVTPAVCCPNGFDEPQDTTAVGDLYAKWDVATPDFLEATYVYLVVRDTWDPGVLQMKEVELTGCHLDGDQCEGVDCGDAECVDGIESYECLYDCDSLDCDDGDACTTDTCSAESGCANDAVACDDDDLCTADACEPSCPVGQLYQGRCYAAYDEAGLWPAALDACRALGGDLASIASAEENTFVNDLRLAECSGDAWLGGTDADLEGTFVWTDGTGWGYTNWYNGDGPPATVSNADYVKQQGNGVWFNLRTDLPAPCYICELPPAGACVHVGTGAACDDADACTIDLCDATEQSCSNTSREICPDPIVVTTFSAATDLALLGAAAVSDGALSLSAGEEAAVAWWSEPRPAAAGFDATFSAHFLPSDDTGFGFAFVLQGQGLDATGGAQGLGAGDLALSFETGSVPGDQALYLSVWNGGTQLAGPTETPVLSPGEAGLFEVSWSPETEELSIFQDGDTLLVAPVASLETLGASNDDQRSWVGFIGEASGAEAQLSLEIQNLTYTDTGGCSADACGDGEVCTADGCAADVGCTTEPASCDDGDSCTTDACEADYGCVHTPVPGCGK